MAEQVRASHILLMYKGSMRSTAQRSKDDAAKLIQELLDKAKAGADFGELAREFSDCPSGEDGGDLGFFPKGAMVPEFDKAAFAMQPGELSDVVETAFGYHIIQRTA